MAKAERSFKVLEPGKRKKFEDRVIKELERMFPSPEPDKHRYLIDKDKYSFYLYDSRPKDDGSGQWSKVPIAKFSFMEGEHLWQVSWMPPQGRWQKYGRYFDLETASYVIKGDPAGCFTGEVSPLAYLKKKDKG